MANVTNQWCADKLGQIMKSTSGVNSEDFPADTTSLQSWLDWPAGKGGKYLEKISNPKLLYKGDIIIRDPAQDYIAVVTVGGAVTSKYSIVFADSSSQKFIKTETTGPVQFILRWKGAFDDSNPSTVAGSARDRILQAIYQQWGASRGGELPSMYVAGVRGLFTRGNERGIYDDGIVVVGPGTFSIFRANTDPSASYKSGVASLLPGVYPYKPGIHKPGKPGAYPAFRANTPNEILPVSRDGRQGVFAGQYINIHRGGLNSTSSLGCQTIQSNQWNQFYSLVRTEMTKVGTLEFNYILCALG